MIKLSEKQAEVYFLENIEQSLVLCDGVVRSGKTMAALWGCLRYLSKYYTGQKFGVAVKSVRQWNDIVVDEVEKWCKLTNHSYRSTANGIILASSRGGTNKLVRIIASDDRSTVAIKGLTLVGCYVDEASELREDFLQMLSSRCSVKGAKQVYTFNPTGGKRHWFYKKYIEGAEQVGALYVRFLIKDGSNPSLADDFYSKERAKYPSGHQAARLLDGEWVEAEGQVWDFENNVKRPPKMAPKAIDIAVDVGSKNPTHALLVARYGSAGTWVLDEWRFSSEEAGYRMPHHQQVKTMISKLRKHGRPSRWFIDPAAADFKVNVQLNISSGNTTGAVVSKMEKALNNVELGIDQVAFYLAQHKIYINPKCELLLNEMGNYRYLTTDSKAAKAGDVVVKEDDHGCDALRYWCMGDATLKRMRAAKRIQKVKKS